MPTQPITSGCSAGILRATIQISAAPHEVFNTAASHSFARGAATGGVASRHAAASIPGHKKRYPKLRATLALTPSTRARNHVSHLHPKKMAIERNHMNCQGSSRDRNQHARTGNNTRGTQLNHRKRESVRLCALPMDLVAAVVSIIATCSACKSPRARPIPTQQTAERETERIRRPVQPRHLRQMNERL